MLVQEVAFEKVGATKTLTNKLIMHPDRAVGKSPAGLCRCFSPEMIILDIMMPNLDGIEVCLRLRQWLPGVLRDFLPGRETRAY